MANQATKVKRIRRVAAETTQQTLPQGTYRGFGAQGAETYEQFQDRLWEIPAFEAALYGLEYELEHPERISVNEFFPVS